MNISTLRVRHLFFTTVFLLAGFPVSFAQTPTEISGVINEYAVVTGVSYPRTIAVADITPFAEGDTVLLIQMKGSTALVHIKDDTNYGIRQNVRNAGAYEFLIIESVTGNDILFTRNFVNDDANSRYHPDDLLQLVKVKSYRNAVVRGGPLVPKAWDGSTGGVLALIVKNVLSLEDDIDGTGKGFRGGQSVELGADTCMPLASSLYSYPEAFMQAGRKGEGIAMYYWDNDLSLRFPLGTDYAKGRGRIMNAGGGGNSLYAGGGGGGGFNRGGFGGRPTCPDGNSLRAISGNGLITYYNDFPWGHRLYMSGGGGSGTSFQTLTASPGGNAGGILIIMAKEIVAGDYFIRSDGTEPPVANGGGAGGGGAGGAVVMIIDQFDFQIKVNALGGKGGSTIAPTPVAPYPGPGGGGGGGVLFYRQPVKPTQIEFNGNQMGSGRVLPNYGPNFSSDGVNGDHVGNFAIRLNGFLFNNLEDYYQLVCQNIRPDVITGTIPKGGTPPYTFEWQISTNLTDWQTIADSTRLDLHPAAFTSPGDKYIRRIVRDSDPFIPIVDMGLPTRIEVLPKIENNLLPSPAPICQGDTPAVYLAELPVGGNGVNYSYQWQQRGLTGSWTNSPGTSQAKDYSAPVLFDTTFYRRIVVSSVCVDTSSFMEQPVHPEITNNIISGGQSTCSNKVPSSLSGLLPGGGISSYTYLWQFRTTGDWTDAQGFNAGQNYSFSDPIPVTAQYRRVSYSGACLNNSPSVNITIYPEIQGNTVSSNQTICSDTSPSSIGGGTLSGGDNNFRFSWQISTNGSTWGTIPPTLQNYQPPSLSVPTYFRRIAKSGPADECQNTSNHVFIDFRPLRANIISSIDTVCDNASTPIRLEFSGEGPFTVTLLRSGVAGTPVQVNNNPGIANVNPRSNDSITFVYTIGNVLDGIGCAIRQDSISGQATVRVYGIPQTNAGSDQEICGLEVVLNAVPGMGKGSWTHSNPPWDFISNDRIPNARVQVPDYGIYTMTWQETNWQCVNSDQVNITFWEEPEKPDAGPDQSLNYIFSSFMNASPASVGTGTWTSLNGPVNIVFPSDPMTQVNNLTYGPNLFEWAVRNGVCPVKRDTVNIQVSEIFRPTGFSPNNDGMNDFLEFPGLENAQTNQLVVVNRQGNEVFKAVNYQNNWDGTRTGTPLPDDTYYYLLTVDNKHTYKGFIVLKR